MIILVNIFDHIPSEEVQLRIYVSFVSDQGLLPIHCAAMQGRLDALEILVESDKQRTQEEIFSGEDKVRFVV